MKNYIRKEIHDPNTKVKAKLMTDVICMADKLSKGTGIRDEYILMDFINRVTGTKRTDIERLSVSDLNRILLLMGNINEEV